MNQYEAMFVFDPTFGNPFEKCEAEVGRLMERAGAQIIYCRKWDERRLAFRIKGRKRGIYVLVYFESPPDKIAPMERDAKLSEHILRLLILRADHVTRETMEKMSAPDAQERVGPAAKTEKAPESAPVATDKPQDKKVVDVEAKPVTTETAVADPPDDGPAKSE